MSSRLATQSASVVRGAWSQVMRGNPFAFLGTSFGIEPTARLPGPSQLISLLVLASRSSSAEFADMTREFNEECDRVFDDVGYERKSFAVTAKPEEQTLEDFTEGAKVAFDRVTSYWRKGEKLDVEEALGKELRNLQVRVQGDATKAEVKRVTFAVKAQGVGLDDLQPRPRTWFWDVLDSWRCSTRRNEVAMYEANGVFAATFDLDRDVADLVADLARERNIDHAQALGVLFRERHVTWPTNPLVFEKNDRTYVGFLLVDVDFEVVETTSETTQDDATLTVHVVRKSTWTFARRVDPRPAARWDYDWRVVDVDASVTQNDWRNLARLFA